MSASKLFDLAADLSREHAKAISPEANRYYDEIARLPNDKHPGPACSCRECLRTYPSRDLDAELDDAQRKEWLDDALKLADCYAPYEKGNEPP